MIKGENHIIQIQLYQVDGVTPLVLADLSFLSASINQDITLARYVFGTDAEIRQGPSTSIVEVEVKKIVSNRFRKGAVYMTLTMELVDAEFEVDLVHKDIAKFTLFSVS